MSPFLYHLPTARTDCVCLSVAQVCGSLYLFEDARILPGVSRVSIMGAVHICQLYEVLTAALVHVDIPSTLPNLHMRDSMSDNISNSCSKEDSSPGACTQTQHSVQPAHVRLHRHIVIQELCSFCKAVVCMPCGMAGEPSVVCVSSKASCLFIWLLLVGRTTAA